MTKATQYGMLNTTAMQAYVDAWPVSDYGPAPSIEALAIALAMPSVDHTGNPGVRQSLKAPGLGTFYLAQCLRWATSGVTHTGHDMAFSLATKQVKPSNKANWRAGLTRAGYIMRGRGVDYGDYVALTDRGLRQVKAVCPALYQAAKAFSDTAYAKALKAHIKGEAPVKVAKVKKAKVQPVDAEVMAAVDAADAALRNAEASLGAGYTANEVEQYARAENPEAFQG